MSGGAPPVTQELARRMERVATRFLAARMEGIARQPGNPAGISIRELDGGGTLLAARTLSLDWMNSAYGVPTIRACDEALATYGELGIRPRFVMLPGDLTLEIAQTLATAGLAQTAFNTGLYGQAPADALVEVEGVSVRQVPEREIDLFLDVFLAGFEAPPAIREGSKANMRHWAGVTAFRLYLCEAEGEPAGAGVLFIDDGIGYLAAAATLPEQRRKGCHAALIQRRMRDASDAGCELITGQAAFASTSQNNMERAGLRIAYTKAIWTLLE